MLVVLAQRFGLLRGNTLSRRVGICRRISGLLKQRTAFEALSLVTPEVVYLLALRACHSQGTVILAHLALRSVFGVNFPENAAGQKDCVRTTQ